MPYVNVEINFIIRTFTVPLIFLYSIEWNLKPTHYIVETGDILAKYL